MRLLFDLFFVWSSVECGLSRHESSKLLLISLDGFRWDYLDRAERLNMGNFTQFYSEGVRAQWMTNQFQTKTFPNHWTMVTGLYEETHGIVANQFYDPSSHQHFNYTDPSSWNETTSFWGGEPLWITNQKAGHHSGCEFWVGSEVKDRTPTYFDRYSSHKPYNDRVDSIVDWLNKPEVNLGLLYIEEPDHTGHMFGPDSKEVDAKLEELNNVIGYLMSELKSNELYEYTNVIITSDHGMASLSEDNLILLDQDDENDIRSLMDMNESKLMTNAAFIFPKSPEVKEELYEKLQKIRKESYPDVLDVWYREDIPTELHYSENNRIPDIVLNAENHYSILFNKTQWDNFHLMGQHGWVPSTKDMHPIFMARGPDFITRKDPLPPFPNVDLYPLCCHLLKLTPAPNNGSLAKLQPYLAQPMDLALPIAMGVLFAVFITGVIVYAVYSQFWDWRPQTLINDSLRSNVQYEGL